MRTTKGTVVAMRCGLLAAMALAACGPKVISETRMVRAPAREASCGLDLVQVDFTSYAFHQQWEILGYVTVGDRGTPDPMAEENRSQVRGRACNMGGTAIAVMAAASSTNAAGFGTASDVTYMVLRLKSATPAAPTAF